MASRLLMSHGFAGAVHPEVPTPAERKALIFLSSVIVLGGATRLYRSGTDRGPVSTQSSEALAYQIAAVDSAIAAKRPGGNRGGKKRSKKASTADPPVVPAVIDLDVAFEGQIETLRGIGPALAARIVANRDSFGAFGSMEGLERVRGIGPALAVKLAANVTFSGVPRPVNTVASRRSVIRDPKRKSRRR